MAGTHCGTCRRPLAPLAGTGLLACAPCGTMHVPAAAQELSLVARTAIGAAGLVATIPLTRAFRDRYDLGEVLGSGAMGMVCRARDRAMQRDVAVKFLMRIDDPELLQRFEAEGQMMARVRHAHVIPVFDLEVMGGHPYIVTEYLEGGTLRRRFVERTLGIPAALDVIAACLDGLAECHACGIIHRDLKPENILFTGRNAGEQPKLADLGIARQLSAADRVTHSGMLIGTPRYMSPEQAQQEEATFASDVHAMGAILFEAVAGRPPFVAKNLADLLAKVIGTAPPPLDACASEPVPPGLARIVERALAKAPAERPGVKEFADEVRQVRAAMEPAGPARRSARIVARPRSSPPAGEAVTRTMAAGVLGAIAALVLAAFAWRAREVDRLPVRVGPPSATPAPRPPAALVQLRRDVRRLELELQEIISKFNEVVSAQKKEPLARLQRRLPEIETAARKVQQPIAATLDRLRSGGDGDARPLAELALLCRVEVLEWRIRMVLDQVARLKAVPVDFRSFEGGIRLLAGSTPSVKTVDDCLRLQRVLRRMRRVAAHGLAELVREPEELTQLLSMTESMGVEVDSLIYHCRRDARDVLFMRDPSAASGEPAEKLIPLLERASAELIAPGAREETRLLFEVMKGLWYLHTTDFYLRSRPGAAGQRVPLDRLEQGLIEIQHALGANAGMLDDLIRVVERRERGEASAAPSPHR